MDYVFCGSDSGGRNEDILTLTSKSVEDFSVFLFTHIFQRYEIEI